MKLLKKGAIAATLPLAVFVGTLYAQPADPTPPAPAPAVSPPASKQILLTPDEMRVSITALEGQVRADTQHIQHLQATVRTEKDVIKLSCVNDKYVKLKAEANIFDKSSQELVGVIERDERHTAYSKVTQAADRVHKVREEADACVGEKEIKPGDSGNSFVPPDITDDPTQSLPFDVPGGVFEPPVYASPYT